MEWLLYALAAALILVGVVGTVMPGIPGIPLVLAGMVLAAAVDSFRLVSWWTLGVLAALTALSVVIEYLAAALGARRVGASPWAMAGAVLGGLAGIAFGPIGMLVGPLVGAVAGELLARRDLRQAGRAGIAAWLGFLVGTVAKAGIVVVMLAVFGAALLVR
jgi:uncharacterized protein YqgC (DUF456 family)